MSEPVSNEDSSAPVSQDDVLQFEEEEYEDNKEDIEEEISDSIEQEVSEQHTDNTVEVDYIFPRESGYFEIYADQVNTSKHKRYKPKIIFIFPDKW